MISPMMTARCLYLQTSDEEYGQEVELRVDFDITDDEVHPDLTIKDEAGKEARINGYLLPQLIEALTQFQKEVPSYASKKASKK